MDAPAPPSPPGSPPPWAVPWEGAGPVARLPALAAPLLARREAQRLLLELRRARPLPGLNHLKRLRGGGPGRVPAVLLCLEADVPPPAEWEGPRGDGAPNDITNDITDDITDDITNILSAPNDVTATPSAAGDVTRTTSDVTSASGGASLVAKGTSDITGDVTNITDDITRASDDVIRGHNDTSMVTKDISGITDDVTNATSDASIVTVDVSGATDDVTDVTDDVTSATNDTSRVTQATNDVTDDVTNTTADVTHAASLPPLPPLRLLLGPTVSPRGLGPPFRVLVPARSPPPGPETAAALAEGLWPWVLRGPPHPPSPSPSHHPPPLLPSELPAVTGAMAAAVAAALGGAGAGMVPAGGAVLDPGTGRVVAAAGDGRRGGHPLGHATMRCLEAVARCRRGGGAGGYLCQGWDVVLTREPCALCAMALVLARARRVLYGAPAPQGALGTRYGLHGRSRLNHRYGAYGGVAPAVWAPLGGGDER